MFGDLFGDDLAFHLGIRSKPMNEELDQESNLAGDTVPYIPKVSAPEPITRVIVEELYDQTDELAEHIRTAAQVLGTSFPLGQLVLADWLIDAYRLRKRIDEARRIVFA